MVGELLEKNRMQDSIKVLVKNRSVIYGVIFLCASIGNPASAGGSDVMKEIADGGIYCKSSSSAIDGFFAYAEKSCKGKKQCVVRATDVASEKVLLSHGCTGFFVAPLCGAAPLNVETHDVLGQLEVSCSS